MITEYTSWTNVVNILAVFFNLLQCFSSMFSYAILMICMIQHIYTDGVSHNLILLAKNAVPYGSIQQEHKTCRSKLKYCQDRGERNYDVTRQIIPMYR